MQSHLSSEDFPHHIQYKVATLKCFQLGAWRLEKYFGATKKGKKIFNINPHRQKHIFQRETQKPTVSVIVGFLSMKEAHDRQKRGWEC